MKGLNSILNRLRSIYANLSYCNAVDKKLSFQQNFLTFTKKYTHIFVKIVPCVCKTKNKSVYLAQKYKTANYKIIKNFKGTYNIH